MKNELLVKKVLEATDLLLKENVPSLARLDKELKYLTLRKIDSARRYAYTASDDINAEYYALAGSDIFPNVVANLVKREVLNSSLWYVREYMEHPFIENSEDFGACETVQLALPDCCNDGFIPGSVLIKVFEFKGENKNPFIWQRDDKGWRTS
ncbi:MAG: hypothetical protein WC533_01970 [Candidatus Pacearchaeota archaeon]